MIRFKLDDTRFYETQRYGHDATRYILWKNEWYVVHDEYKRSLQTLSDKEVLAQPYVGNVWTADKGDPEPGCDLLYMCWGGIGDLISLTPIFRALKEEHGFERIILSSPGISKDWFNGYIDHAIGYPVMQRRVEACDYIFLLEDIFKLTFTRNLTDVFEERMGLSLSAERKQPFLAVDNDVVEYVRGLLPEKRGKYVAIHFAASTPERSIPIEKALAVAMSIADKGHTALLFGKWSDLTTHVASDHGRESQREIRPGVYNLCGLLESQTEIIAAMSLADFFIGPDSGLLHIAGALKKDGLAIFAPYPSSVRLAYYPTIRGIDVDEKYHTYNRDTFFPEEEQRALYNEAMESIDWDAIVEEAVS